MPKVTPRSQSNTVTVKTKSGPMKTKPGDWWNSNSKKELSEKLLATAAFLKQQDQYRYRQASLYAALYGKTPLFGTVGTNLSRITSKNPLPSDRPTMSIVTSITDTIVSRLTQNKHRPFFLTDGGDYKQRKLAKEMNTFISGELYQTKAYELKKKQLRDSCVWGTGVLKVLESQDKKVAVERRLPTQLLVDPNEAFLGDPRQMYELMLIDRSVLMSMHPDFASTVENAEEAYPDQSGDSTETVSDLVMVVEAWRLPSGPDSSDGMHVIACSSGLITPDKEYKKTKFPFDILHYSEPQVGFWGQGVAERQMGNQSTINGLLMTTHKAIRLVGVPRVYLEDGSKVVKAQFNNEIGSIITFRGTKPITEVAPCMPAEVYAELQRVIERAYQEEGISELAAGSKKPAGLDSGEAIREYDDTQSDRLSSLDQAMQESTVNLAYLIIDQARDIAERDGSYETVYPDKNGTQEIDLPASKLLDNPFVIQCFDVSSLPKDPAGRQAKIAEWVQAGMYTPQEGRRLMGLPDTEQEDKLANAGEERILKILDQIVEDGKFTPPDPFMDLELAELKCTQYYNLYLSLKLEEKKAQMLRDFFAQVGALKSQAASAMQPQAPGINPQASPMPAPQSQLIPNVPGVA